MKRLIAAVIITITATLHALAQQETIPVFTAGTEGYKSFRIPALIGLPDGSLLAFAEGRVNGAGDFGNIDLVMKKSRDHGKTWSPLQVVAEYGDLQLSNPGPVVDLTDPAFPAGRVFLFYNTGNNHETETLKGNGVKHCMYIVSADGGNTWGKPVDITLQVHKPRQPQEDPAFNFAEDWRYYANTPGHVMQFREGKYKGRIFVAANHTAGEPVPHAEHYVAHGYYTDDHGKTFHLGNNITFRGSNESMAAELSGSRLMMNSRNQKGDVRERIVSVSSDGGATWDTTWFEHQLPDAVCQGSILTIGKRKGKNILAVCNAADPHSRNNLTLRISYDDGRTWPRSQVIYKGGGQTNPRYSYAAYSDMTVTGKQKIGLIYEKDNYSSIVFTTVHWK
ncbi:sialidase family protein [Chitinophaga solisilvae]|uniref:sialidase family protein n=1 Tax=Chitinophaga solisilvae TaxID=1233460 RepID=UPI00136D41A5|nr:sialidase family protein [Chitinophaga solisilvae]